MGNFDRQLTNYLDKIHRQMFGTRNGMEQCRWYYSSKQDIYHCPHTAIYGKDLMPKIPEWTDLTGQTTAKDDWDDSPESEHTL